MQQDNNFIDKLRELDDAEAADISNLNNDWKNMRAMLPTTKKGIGKNYLRNIIAGIVLFGVIAFFLKNNFFGNKNESSNNIVTANNNQPKNIETKSKNDSASKKDSTIKNTVTQKNVSYDVNDFEKLRSALLNAKPIFDEGYLGKMEKKKEDGKADFLKKDVVEKFEVVKKDSVVKTISESEKQQMLNNLLKSIKKTGETFKTINSRDTIISGKEGTTIFIPANSFSGGDTVVFELKEFYKYSDMIKEGLTTTSDDKQLISGGMFFLSAKINGKEVQVNPNKEIKVFIPNLSSKDSMQIFEGVENGKKDFHNESVKSSIINWNLTKISIDSPVIKMFIRAIDLRDENISIGSWISTKNWSVNKAIFTRSKKSALSKEELKQILQKKYGDYYDKIIVRNQWKRNLLFKVTEDMEDEEYYKAVYNSWGVGDTSVFLPSTVRIYKLTPIDSVFRVVRTVHKGYKDGRYFSTSSLSQIGEKYSINLNKLGWINCDKFYNYKGKKADFSIDLKDSSHNYVTYLIFDKFKSIMEGFQTGNISTFYNIPIGEPVKILCVGIKDGKPVSAFKNTVSSMNMLNDLDFKETSTNDLKNTISNFDSLPKL